jgi:rubrerythrin
MANFLSPAEVVGMAVETEKAGRQFYEQVTKKATLPVVKELFSFLGSEEVKHERTFAGLYAKLKEQPVELPYDWDEVTAYLNVITDSRFFLGPDKALALAQAASDEREALESALQFEKETLLFYLETARLVAEPHRAVIGEIARQERHHIRLLSEMKAERRGK